MAIVFRRLPNLLQLNRCGLASLPSEMQAYEIGSYGPTPKEAIEQLHMTKTRRVPPISSSSDVLVRVGAISLNPIDVYMLTGYGSSAFKSLRTLLNPCESTTEFPLTPGRDFAGEVVLTGPGASDLDEGTQVIGANLPYTSSAGNGSLAEFVTCSRKNLAKLPATGVSLIDGAALSYAGLTAWEAVRAGGLYPTSEIHQQPSALRVLVTGVSGGVGGLAAQLVKLSGVGKLIVTSSTSVKEADLKALLHPDEIIFAPDLPPPGARYDLIIDCIRPKVVAESTSDPNLNHFKVENFYPLLPYLEPGCNSRYVTLNPPTLGFIDQWGLAAGLGRVAFHAVSTALQSRSIALRPAFFQPNGANLQRLIDWLSQGRIQVPIDSTFEFADAKKAFSKMLQKGNKGKIVVTVP